MSLRVEGHHSRVEFSILKDGQKIAIEAALTDRVSMLFEKLREKLNVSRLSLGFVLNHVMDGDCYSAVKFSRDHEGIVADLHIIPGGMYVYSEIFLGGGVGFGFNSMETKKHIDFSPDAPSWCRISQGLSLRGRCANGGCAANGKTIYIKFGIGKFEIGKEMYKAKCPNCGGVEPIASNN